MQLEDGKQSGRAVSICGLEVSTYETLRRASSPGCCMICRMAAALPVQQEIAAVGHLSAALAAYPAQVAVDG